MPSINWLATFFVAFSHRGMIFSNKSPSSSPVNTLQTDFLVSSGSFLVGMGSVMNLAGGYFQYNFSRNGADADMSAMFRDWRVIGEQIENVASEERQKTENPQLQLGLA